MAHPHLPRTTAAFALSLLAASAVQAATNLYLDQIGRASCRERV